MSFAVQGGSIMKYFTKELWTGANSADKDVRSRTDRIWKRNCARYFAVLKRLAPRLGARNGKFFTDHSLHDGSLLRFLARDWPVSVLRGRWAPTSRTGVEIAALSFDERPAIYHLKYAGIEGIDVRTGDDLFPRGDSTFQHWGYDELLPEGKGLFRHSILFSTGTEVSVVFRRFSFSRIAASKSALRRYATG
jgi:hypothetical protein